MTLHAHLHHLPAITVKQPWTAHILTGAKPVENRTWGTRYRGDILLHAGKAFDSAAPPCLSATSPLATATGAIIAVVELYDIVSADEAFLRLPAAAHRFIEGEFCWLLRNIRPLPAPLPCLGSLGLWKPKAIVWQSNESTTRILFP